MTPDPPADEKQRRLEAMVAARHAILALRQLHEVPDGTTGHGIPITVGCVTHDLGQMADKIRAHFLGGGERPARPEPPADTSWATFEKTGQ